MIIESFGPMGSGKTETLRALLSSRKHKSLNGILIESGHTYCRETSRKFFASRSSKKAKLISKVRQLFGTTDPTSAPILGWLMTNGISPDLTDLCKIVLENYSGGFADPLRAFHRLLLFQITLAEASILTHSPPPKSAMFFDEFFSQRCLSFCIQNPDFLAWAPKYISSVRPKADLIISFEVDPRTSIERLERRSGNERQSVAAVRSAHDAHKQIMVILEGQGNQILRLSGTDDVAANIEKISERISHVLS